YAMRVPSIDFEGAISWKDYVEPGGGESGYIAISPKAPHRVMGGGIGTGAGHGRLISWNPETGQKRNITVWPEVHGSGAGSILHTYRFQWTFPVAFSHHDTSVLYVTSNHVHRSTDEGENWEVISPDLTHNDPEKLQASGGPITADNSGAEIYCTIFAFAESPHEAGVLWAGSDDGLIHLSRDNGGSWQEVTPKDLPGWALISIIEPSPHDAATVYVAATRYKHDDYAPYLYRTTDHGQTWTRITTGIPTEEYVRTVRADPNRRGLLYAGTETGLHVSFDDGAHWQPFQGNLPVTPIHDLAVKGNDLIAATHGRAFWILDDLTPLYQLQEETAGKAAHLFTPRPTTRFRLYGRPVGASKGRITYKMTGPVTVGGRLTETTMGTQEEEFLDAGKNPPDGVIIHYWLKDMPEGEVTLSILDASGSVLRTFSSTSADPPRVPAAQGANRFVWDMREEGAAKLDEPPRDQRSARMMAEGVAPHVLPGTYQVQLQVGGETLTESFTIERDPRVAATDRDLEEQYRLKRDIRDRVSQVRRAVNQIRSVRKQVEAWEARAKDAGKADALSSTAAALKDHLAALEGELIQVDAGKAQPGPAALHEKLTTLGGMIDESDDRPTAGARQVYGMLSGHLAEVTADLRQALERDLAEFNRAVGSSGIPAVVG
ncbi:MAG TPA: glycosyl hydrolase, partial [Thermomicrobiaceae bacterium]|nr:glycosyl hydrolase [Thermomicrobiaceae bacterium]